MTTVQQALLQCYSVLTSTDSSWSQPQFSSLVRHYSRTIFMFWHVSLNTNPKCSGAGKPWKCKHCFQMCLHLWRRSLTHSRSSPLCPLPCPRDGVLGEGAVAVLLSSLWCQRHVKTTPSSCDRGGCRSSAIPNSNWWPPAVPTVAMTLFCFMFHRQEAAYSPGHIGSWAGWVNGLSFSFKTWW